MNCAKKECYERHVYNTQNKEECIRCLLKSEESELSKEITTPLLTIKMNEEQEQQKQERTIERNKRIIRITLYVLFIALILLIARLLLMVLGIM